MQFYFWPWIERLSKCFGVTKSQTFETLITFISLKLFVG